jgi:hypothetical protein
MIVRVDKSRRYNHASCIDHTRFSRTFDLSTATDRDDSFAFDYDDGVC